ncbi:sugar-binding domain-containing protein, partial [Bacteroidota bacterium]
KNMKYLLVLFSALILFSSCSNSTNDPRITEDFNFNWKFNLGDEPDAFNPDFDDSKWKGLRLPHDWSIEEGYQQEGASASTGFVPGGIGWYRKSFKLEPEDKGKHISIVFDGVYNNSSVWINGHFLGKRPYGYTTFSYELSDHLNFDGTDNLIAVKVDRTAFADSRWYTGSGIYRKVQLIKKYPLHISQWGVKITTPFVTSENAEVSVRTDLENSGSGNVEDVILKYVILDPNGNPVANQEVGLNDHKKLLSTTRLQVEKPLLWSIDESNLYTLQVDLMQKGELVDRTSETFGIRTFNFDADKGFFLNGKSVKMKGVNLHHDAGAVGSAVPKALWEYRVEKLKSVGVNAIRGSHNPHSPDLMEVCDEMGILFINEFFDEWHNAKGKDLLYKGDGAAGPEMSRSYNEEFSEWAERDVKDQVSRDFNHPCVIMWSIGNEIEWTFPHYSETYNVVNREQDEYAYTPVYDIPRIKKEFDKITGGVDSLAIVAHLISGWIKEIDTSRPLTCGSVRPAVSIASGYADAVDVLGFNYRAADYDAAHKALPELIILGSENWVAYSEWQNIVDRDFISGIFVWTGFAYLGEAGPWPRKGLDISLFDFAGFKTPRGHFFECLWKPEAKVYMVTTPAGESEYSFTEDRGWNFEMQYTKPPVWRELRKWEWYKVYEKWKYNYGDDIIVQAYTNCEEAELFLNGKSLGKQKRSDFEDDNIIKWLVPYNAGELKVVGLNNGIKADEYVLNTTGGLAKIAIESSKTGLDADGYDVAVITALLLDEDDNLITDADHEIVFNISGAGYNIGIDNGWEYNIQSHKLNSITTHNGKAIVIIQSTQEKGSITISAKSGDIISNSLELDTE